MNPGLNEAQLRIIRDVLTAEVDKIEKVAVFSSRAQGNHRPNSDLDLVCYGPIDETTIDRLWTLFQDSPLPFSVDVKSYRQISYARLRNHIDTAGRDLFIKTVENGQSILRACVSD